MRRHRRRHFLTQCAAQQFDNISSAQFAFLMAAAKSQGIEIDGTDGQTTQSGITISWSYVAATRSLTIQCLRAPFYITCGMIHAKIRDLVSACRAQEA